MSQPDSTPPNHLRSTSGALGREPVLTANLIAALVLEVCVLLRAFGVPLTDGQQNAINSVAGIVLVIGAAVIARRFTTPLSAPRDDLGRSLTPQVPPPGASHPEGGRDPLG